MSGGAPAAPATAEGAAGGSGQRAGQGAAGGGAGLDPRLFLLGLTACHALNDLYGLVVPPLLPAIQEAFRLNYLQLGLISFSTTVVSAAAQPLVGYAADLKRKRRLALLAGFLLYPPAMLLLAVAPTYAALLGAGALLGLAASTYHPQSTTLLFDRFRERRGAASGVHGMGNGIGFALAPLIVGPLAARLGWREAAAVMALPALLGVALVLLGWRRVAEPGALAARGLRAGVSRPLLLLTAVNGIQQAVVAGFVTFLPAYYASRGVGLAGAGLLTAPVLAAGLLSQPLGGALSDRYGRRTLLLGAFAALGVCMIGFAQAEGLPLAVLAVLIGAFGSLASPIVLVYAAELARGGRTGQAVGIAWGVGIAISSVAAPVTGAAIDAFGFAVAQTALGLLALLAALGTLWLPRVRPAP